MTRRAFIRHLRRLGACNEAMEWVLKTKGTPAELWRRCNESDWLCWLVCELDVYREYADDKAHAAAKNALNFVEYDTLYCRVFRQHIKWSDVRKALEASVK